MPWTSTADECEPDALLPLPAGAFSLPTPPLTQAVRPRALRLPSFSLLGIAFPHPDSYDTRRLRSIQHTPVVSVGGAAVDVDRRQALPVLTPPEEDTHFEWKALAVVPESETGDVSSAVPALNSSSRVPRQQPEHIASDANDTLLPANADADALAALDIDEMHINDDDDDDEDDGVSTPRAQPIVVEGLDSSLTWLAPSIMAVASCVSSTRAYGGSTLKVLSHALPLPTLPGHVYAHVIDTIRAQCTPGQLQWINLMHAVQGRLNLADLPSSPPATPGPPIGGEDYFTTRVFSSAVTTPDDDGVITPRASSDRLLSPPGSVELSIVERYIPPSVPGEVNNMFSIEYQSILVDRLVELTPKGGCLNLIYPTRRGGETFQRDYLNPILDPMLRTMMNMHGLSADFGETVSQMTMIRKMLDYNALRARLLLLCETLNRDDAQIRARLHGIRGTFSVVYSEKLEVSLANAVWSNWWVRQEKQRLQNAVLLYFVRGSRLPEDGKYQQAVLVQEMLSGLSASAATAKQPVAGIEMGVFVIKRE